MGIFRNSIFANRDFLLFWSGQFISWTGTEISTIALPLIVLAITGSSAQAGIIVGVRGLVYIFVSLPAGVLVDRFDRKRIMLVGNLGSGVATAVIAIAILLNRITVPELFVLGSLEAAFFTFANLARFSSLVQIVGQENMPKASAQINLASHTSELIGPAIGGFLYQTVGAFVSFFLDSLSYFVNVFFLIFVKAPLTVEKKQVQRSVTHETKEGIIWAWHEPVIRLFTLTSAGRLFIDSGVYLLLIILAKQIHTSSAVIGLLFGIGAIGGVIGSISSSWVYHRVTFYHILVATTSLCFLFFPLYLFAHSVVLLGAITFLLTVLEPIYFVCLNTYSAKAIPNELRGRVNSIARLTQFAGNSAGFFVMGVMLEKAGVTVSVLVFTLVLFIIALMVLSNNALKRLERID